MILAVPVLAQGLTASALEVQAGAETVAELEARRLLYILGVRERSDKLVRELAWPCVQPVSASINAARLFYANVERILADTIPITAILALDF
jgi:hypothetical protein